MISFSGGRTSGYMLHKILEAHDGQLSDDVFVQFSNTGKEMPQTLDFVHECSKRWNVDVIWFEYRKINNEHNYCQTNYEEASRQGEPFKELLDTYKYKRTQKGMEETGILPNPVMRFCTQYLKINNTRNFFRDKGIKQYTTVMGLRYDEPRRVASMRRNDTGNRTHLMPLYDAQATREDVNSFWKANDFDLQLPLIDGETPHGNCDLCFLKSRKKIETLIKENPNSAQWWSDMEKEYGALWRRDRMSYGEMIDLKDITPEMFGNDIDLGDCFCTD